VSAEFSTDDEEAVLAVVIPGMVAGDRVVVHEEGCALGNGGECDCERLVVNGPSGEA
jgi:hypothetical protein